MKLSARTLQILKNFASINKSIVFRKGNILSTISPNKEILARAQINETFDIECAIYELPRFLGTLSLFNDPDIQFDTNHLKIIDGKQTISFYYTDQKMIVAPSDKTISLSNAEINFKMDQSTYIGLMKALNVLQLPAVCVLGDRQTVRLAAMDVEKKINDRYEVEVGTTPHEFKMTFKGEHFKLLPEDYEVSISAGGISSFKGGDIQYWIAVVGKNSTFTK